jgi:hypothetical protein
MEKIKERCLKCGRDARFIPPPTVDKTGVDGSGVFLLL